MSNKEEYFEKYSVAPSPDRDYYGIKVLDDKIIFLLWKISHGPHKTPVVRVSKFSEFDSDKILQDEIQRIYGKYLLEHVKNISGRKLSLLTLPKYIIANITTFLNVEDIFNLSTLSHAAKEVFDNEVIWKVMYTKSKDSKIRTEDNNFAMASGWKQLLKEKKLRESVKSKMSIANESKEISQAINSTMQIKKNSKSIKKSSQETARNLENKITIEKQKNDDSEKKQISVRRCTSSTVGESKKKTVPNQIQVISRGMELKSNRPQTRINRNLITKPKSNLGMKLTENVKSEKNSSSITNRKIKVNQTIDIKNKKVTANSKEVIRKNSKLMTLDIEKSLKKYNDNNDIDPLIEESLKKLKSPRSIFNFEFSVLDKKSFGDSRQSPKSKTVNLINDFEKKDISNSSANIEITSDEEMERLNQNYLNAQTNFTKSMDRVLNLLLYRSPNLQNDSAINEKYQTDPEDLAKILASTSVANDEEDDEKKPFFNF